MIPENLNILLEGVVGSTAYGLATSGSDEDRLGVFAFDTEELFGIDAPRFRYSNTPPDEDRVVHEAGHFAKIALGCNPTLLELLFLPDDLYVAIDPLGDELIGIRGAFLSKMRVRDAYCGYARSQFHELVKNRTFDADLRRRTEKHARHLARLMDGGLQLLTTGELTVQVDDPDRLMQFGKDVASAIEDGAPLLWLKNYVDHMTDRFDEALTTSPLPEHPDRDAVEAWLLRVRRSYLPDNPLR